MASMVVAKASNSCGSQMLSSTLTVQEKGSRNKRKFRADTEKITSLPLSDSSSYEFSADKFEIASCHGQTQSSNMCDLCSSVNIDRSSSETLKLDLKLSSSEVGTSRQREVLDSVESRDADWSDLTESQLEELVLVNLDIIFRGAIKKIVSFGYSEETATRAVLRNGVCYGSKDTLSNIVDNTLEFLRSEQEFDPEDWFEDLQQLEKYVLAELVCVLREIRPFFSTGDAMWCLLVCDMSISYALALGGEPMTSYSPDISLSTTTISEPNNPDPRPTKPKEITHSETKPFTAAATTETSQLPFHEERFGSSRRFHSSSTATKRDYILRQKSLHLDKTYRTYGSKGSSSSSSRSAKLSSLLMDKKLKAVSESATTLKTASLKKNKTVIVSEPLSLPLQEKASNKIDTTNTELTLSLASGVPQREEAIARLGARAGELRAQTREWTEWANQKVMQAARRLSKERDELRSLRRERDEAERLRREKRALEENTTKKLSEMEGALCKASGQVERANAAVRRLELENLALRRDMELAGERAAQSAASCREVSGREKKTLVEFQTWEKRKSFLVDELGAERRRREGLVVELDQAKLVQEQFEGRWRQEEKANLDLLSQSTSTRRERQQIEASIKSKEDSIKKKAENNLRKYKDDIQKLEKEISQLRLKTDSPKIAALRKVPALLPPNKPSNRRSFGVRRERECVMCLSDEMSVVFLPCAHQVVCTNCNELHEKQGMKDCPSCRSTIQRRIPVRYARSSSS